MNNWMHQFKSLPAKVQSTVLLFGMAGTITLSWGMFSHPGLQFTRLILMLLLAVVGSQAKLRLYKDSSISVLTFVVLLSMLAGNGFEALLVGMFGVAVQTYFPARKLVLHRLIFNLGMIAVTIQASCWTYSRFVEGTLHSQLAGAIGAASMYYLGNSLSVSLIIALSKGASILKLWSQHFLFTAPSYLIAGLLSLLTAQLVALGAVLVLILIPAVCVGYYSSLRLVSTNQ